jgi:single-stranded DNA-binding protein
MNTAHLIGELVTPPEIKRDRNSARCWGRTVIAIPRGSKGGIDFVPVTLRDGEADMAARYLGDGSVISVEGHLHSAWRPDPGTDVRAMRHSLWVIADRVTYLIVRQPRGGRP